MNEVMFYGGIVLSVSFFILTVILFIYNKIPGVILYFIQIRRKKVFRTALPATKPVEMKATNVKATNVKATNNVKLNKNLSKEYENTTLLDDVECYVTTLLDDVSTSLLPEYDSEE